MTPRKGSEENKAPYEENNFFSVKAMHHDKREANNNNAIAGVGHVLAEGIEREDFE